MSTNEAQKPTTSEYRCRYSEIFKKLMCEHCGAEGDGVSSIDDPYYPELDAEHHKITLCSACEQIRYNEV